mmetsp:Transcript_43353/g.94902  ORF Transcript_43353/g.94902 Transcript_43353/m.94902 type:complete len:510 (+) Transcript_43353:162-1691(+)
MWRAGLSSRMKTPMYAFAKTAMKRSIGDFLPTVSKRTMCSPPARLAALRDLQDELDLLTAQKERAVRALNGKLHKDAAALRARLAAVVSGAELTAREKSAIPLEEEEVLMLTESLVEFDDRKRSGVPGFWATVLERAFSERQTFADKDMWLTSDDLAVLAYLEDLQVSTSATPDSEGADVLHLKLVFEADNPFLENRELVVNYERDEGGRVVRCDGCDIKWKPGKDPTVVDMEGLASQSRMEPVPTPSFFHLFRKHEFPPDSDVADDDSSEDDLMDFESQRNVVIPEMLDDLEQRIVQNAVAFYMTPPMDSEEDSFESDYAEEASFDDVKSVSSKQPKSGRSDERGGRRGLSAADDDDSFVEFESRAVRGRGNKGGASGRGRGGRGGFAADDEEDSFEEFERREAMRGGSKGDKKGGKGGGYGGGYSDDEDSFEEFEQRRPMKGGKKGGNKGGKKGGKKGGGSGGGYAGFDDEDSFDDFDRKGGRGGGFKGGKGAKGKGGRGGGKSARY